VVVLVIRLPPVSVGGGREWSVVTSVKPVSSPSEWDGAIYGFLH